MFKKLARGWQSFGFANRKGGMRVRRDARLGFFEEMEPRRVLASWTQQQELLSSILSAEDDFGFSVAIDGNLAVVGAPREDVGAITNAGAAFVFQRTGLTWSQVAQLTATGGAANDAFGHAVAISGTTIVVSAIGDDVTFGDEGSVYVFEETSPGTWTQAAHLLPVPDFVGQNTVGENFGESVAIEGNTLVVGSRSDNNAAGVVVGSAYVFRNNGSGWPVTVSNPPQKLRASDGASGDRFGWDVDIYANRVVVGAPRDDGAFTDDGSVYVFDRPTAGSPFAQVAKIVATGDQTLNDEFGYSVAVEGSSILVGAPKEATNGAAYVFTGGGAVWSPQAKLLPPSGSFFGTAVDLQGGLAVVGATGGVNGRAFVFAESGGVWGAGDLIVADDSVDGDGDFFGQSVAIDAGVIVVGSYRHDHTLPANSNSGSAYIFVDPNDAPVNSVPGLQTIDEGETLTFSASNGNAISISDVDAFGSAVRVTLTASNGTLTLGGTAGLAFLGGDGTDDTTMTFDGTIAAINAALDGTVFTPSDADFFGSASVAILTNDLGNSGTGGPLSDSDSIDITVEAVNDAPTFVAGGDDTVDEDFGVRTVVGWATDVDAGAGNEVGQVLMFVVTGNTNPGLFSSGPAIAPDGTLTYTPAVNAHGSALITVKLTDDGGTANGGVNASGEVSFTITVDPVNDAPIAEAQSEQVDEDGSVAITLSGSDVETPESGLTFTIVSLPATGVLTVGGVAVQVGDTFAGPPVLVYEPAAGSGATSAAFDFTVTDNGDDSSAGQADETSAAASVTIDIVPAVGAGMATLDGGILRVGGNGGNDTIQVTRSGTSLNVSINGVASSFLLADVTEMRIWGREGNDTVVVDTSITIPATIDAGAGNDIVSGGGGHDLIFGGGGIDMLLGNGGNDMVIGGDGSDVILGGAGHDVLIGGRVAATFTAAMLRDIAAAWAAARVAAGAVDDGTVDETVVDTQSDILTGGSGADWYIVATGDVIIGYFPFGVNGDLITVI